jgi:transcription elongation factor GreA
VLAHEHQAVALRVRPDQIKTAVVVFRGVKVEIRRGFSHKGFLQRDRRPALSQRHRGESQPNRQKVTIHSLHGILSSVPGDNIFISRKGYQKMLQEVEDLRKRKPQLALDIKEAMEKGDLKENAEYHAAKEELTHVQRRIAELENKMGSARLLEDQANIPADKVYIGATVVVKDESGSEMTYTLVDAAEANPRERLISVTSPLGTALMGHAVEETVKVAIGKDGYKLTILKITRE